jgi:hypothetical protein
MIENLFVDYWMMLGMDLGMIIAICAVLARMYKDGEI